MPEKIGVVSGVKPAAWYCLRKAGMPAPTIVFQIRSGLAALIALSA